MLGSLILTPGVGFCDVKWPVQSSEFNRLCLSGLNIPIDLSNQMWQDTISASVRCSFRHKAQQSCALLCLKERETTWEDMEMNMCHYYLLD